MFWIGFFAGQEAYFVRGKQIKENVFGGKCGVGFIE